LDKEIDMSLFERCVERVVVETLGPVPFGFVNGTLFVTCPVPQAVALETALLESVGAGIILSRVGDESSFDFI
jgi:hypothetical protein